MRNAKSIIVLAAATVLATSLTDRNSLADDTNGATAGTIDFQFENAPSFALIEWVARLTHGPVIVPYNLNFPVTYRTKRKVTPEEALQGIDGVLLTNGYHFVKTDESYYRIVRVAETNSFSNLSHIDLKIQGDKVVINGNTIVDRKDLAKTVAALSNPNTELWIQHPLTGLRAPMTNEAMELLVSLQRLDAHNVFLEYVPEGGINQWH
jgi:hypothetical protein